MSSTSGNMSPKFTTRIRNWVESRFGRGRRRAAGPAVRVDIANCARGCGTGRCQCHLVVAAASARSALTPDSLNSFSSPESAYFTGQSEDSATPLTPATPVTPATPSSAKYFLLQNRDFRPLRQLVSESEAAVDGAPTSRAISTSSPVGMRLRPSFPVSSPPHGGGEDTAQTATARSHTVVQMTSDSPRITSARTAEFVPVTELSELCCSPRERPKIKTNPWVATSTSSRGPPSVSDTSGLDCSLSAETVGSRRQDFQRSYSSGRSSYVSEVSSGSTLAKPGNNAERAEEARHYQSRRDSTYDSMGSRQSEEDVDEGDDPVVTALDRSGVDRLLLHPRADCYSDDVTDDEGDSDVDGEDHHRSPAKRSRGQRHQQERRRSLRDRRRGVRRRSETTDFSPTAGTSPVLPDPSLLFQTETNALLVNDPSFNVGDEAMRSDAAMARTPWEGTTGGCGGYALPVPPTSSHQRRSGRGVSLLPRSFCPSSEPLRRKVFRGSLTAVNALRPATVRVPVDIARPRSSLSMRDGADPRSSPATPLCSHSPSPYSPASFSPACSPAHASARSCRESLEQKIERLRRQRLIVEARIEEAQAEEVQRRQERMRYLADTLQQRRVLLRSMSRYPGSADTSPFREPANARPVSKSRTYFV